MITVAHVTHCMDIWGPQQVILDHCKFHDRSHIRLQVISVLDGPMSSEIANTGVDIYIEPRPGGIRKILKEVDFVNFHLYLGQAHSQYQTLYLTVWTTKIPHVITLHSAVSPTLSDAKTLICTGQWIKFMQRDSSRCEVIPNGVDLTRFYSRFSETMGRDQVILTRVCTPRRCADYFWEAMQKVLSCRQNVELWVVGEEGESSEQVKFLGVRRDIPDILAQTDLFVYTPYPRLGTKDLVVMEAMAMGVPCVLSDVECVRECVTNGQDGLLVPFKDIDGYVEATLKLVDDESYRHQLGSAAAKRAQLEFDVREKVKQYEHVYRRTFLLEHPSVS